MAAIPVGTVTTSTMEGGRLVPVVCDQCRTNFFYQLNREGTGKGSAVMFVGQQGAYDRSQRAAQSNLQKRLASEVELVPCPKCHWVNETAIAQYRKQMYRDAPRLIVFVAVVAFVGSTLALGLLPDVVGGRAAAILSMLLMLASLTSPVWILVGRHVLRKRLDPNRLYPGGPATVPPGTPPALVKTKSPNGGREILRPAAANERP